MGVNLWGESPLYENQKVFIFMDTIKSTSRWQGRFREKWSEGSLRQDVRADEQKPHRRLSLRASWHHTTKPTGSGDRVNAAVMHGKFTLLSGEICVLSVRVSMSVIMASLEAPGMATYRESTQKSAEGIVVPLMWDEGPNAAVSGGLR